MPQDASVSSLFQNQTSPLEVNDTPVSETVCELRRTLRYIDFHCRTVTSHARLITASSVSQRDENRNERVTR